MRQGPEGNSSEYMSFYEIGTDKSYNAVSKLEPLTREGAKEYCESSLFCSHRHKLTEYPATEEADLKMTAHVPSISVKEAEEMLRLILGKGINAETKMQVQKGEMFGQSSLLKKK